MILNELKYPSRIERKGEEKNMINLLIGKSGAGKDTILNRLVEKKNLIPIISYTTRPMRDGEVNGKDYHFVTKEEFDKTPIFESRSYHTSVAGKEDIWYYGSPKINDLSKNYIAIVDVDGAKSYINYFGAENVKVFYIFVSDTLREERAKKRGSFDKTEWDRRVKDDANKFSDKAIKELNAIKINNEEEYIFGIDSVAEYVYSLIPNTDITKLNERKAHGFNRGMKAYSAKEYILCNYQTQ